MVKNMWFLVYYMYKFNLFIILFEKNFKKLDISILMISD